jgi:hypothetical protein
MAERVENERHRDLIAVFDTRSSVTHFWLAH